MEIIRIPRILQGTARTHHMQGRTIGFVPTMGALHEGHLSLARRARQENDIAAASIYVNPVQFGSSEDLSKYPRDLEGDIEKLKNSNIDILFLPDNSGIYPEGFSTHVQVEGLSEKLCGSFRPGHFRGVATVVTKLLNIVQPDRAYFGQKDFQQCAVIKRLVTDLNIPTEVVVCPTVRESSGLAMSSRNAYLTKEERDAAAVIYKSLITASGTVKSGIIDVSKIKELMLSKIRMEPLVSEVQYCSAYDPATLEELKVIGKETLLAVALRIGKARLIDNMLIYLSDATGEN